MNREQSKTDPTYNLHKAAEYDAWLLDRRYGDFADWQEQHEPDLDAEVFEMAVETWEDLS